MNDIKHLTAIEILNEVSDISEFIYQGHRHLDSGDEMSGYIDKLSGYMARLPRLEADAEYLLNYKRGECAEGNKNISATLFREVLAKETALEQKVFKFAHRLNTNILEIVQSARSQLSFLKAQLPSWNEDRVFQEIAKLNKEVERLKQVLSDKL